MTALTVRFCNSSQDMGAVYVARIHMTKMTRKQMLCMRPWINVWMRNERKGERKNCKNKSKNTVKNDQKFSSSFQILRYICFFDSLKQGCTDDLFQTCLSDFERCPWLSVKSLTQNHLPLTAVGSNLARNFGFFHVRKLSCQVTECHLCLK